MSVAPVPAFTPNTLPVSNRQRVKPFTTADAEFDLKPTPAHRIIAKNGVSVIGSGELDTADTAPTAKADKPFSFWDLVDIVNPLQHIPIVSTIYRKITGDEIGSFARVAGGALFGGIAGAAFGGINAILAEDTGKDLGDTVISWFGDDDTNTTETAQAVPTETVVVASSPATSQALFDHPEAHGQQTGSDTSLPVEPPIPVIEVRPQANAKMDLPASHDVASLNDVDPTAGPVAPKPVDKANVQQAMMDALLKMQAAQSNDDENDSERMRDSRS